MGSHPAFVAEDAECSETGMSVDVEHPSRPIRTRLRYISRRRRGGIATSYGRGEHDAILAELGYSPEDIAKFESNDVVFGPA
jgi:crotonobetainyl-CoA:carnitine CoA-transferase CaiB-like acyl-CoA transferase